MTRAAVTLALLVSVASFLTGFLIGNVRWTASSDALSNDKPMTIVYPATADTKQPSYLAQPDIGDVDGGRREPDRQEGLEGGGVSIQAAERTRTAAIAEELSMSRAKTCQLQATIARLTLELDECTNGSTSVLVTLRALPEWTTLDGAQQRTVAAFVERFPLHLLPGEATLIATHTSPTGATTQELIRMLGPERVRATLSADRQAVMQHDDPEEWFEYFGPTR